MINRAEVVDSLIDEGLSEALAWHLVLNISPEYLETLDNSALEDLEKQLISDYLNYLRSSFFSKTSP